MALDPARDFMSGFAFMQNALGSIEDRKYARKLRAGEEQTSAYDNVFVNSEVDEIFSNDEVFASNKEGLKNYFNTYSKDLINNGVDTDNFDAELVDFHKMDEDPRFIAMKDSWKAKSKKSDLVLSVPECDEPRLNMTGTDPYSPIGFSRKAKRQLKKNKKAR